MKEQTKEKLKGRNKQKRKNPQLTNNENTPKETNK